MKFSAQWLRQWLPVTLATDVLREQLTNAGHEVESVAPVAGAIEGVVIADVVAVRPHPKAAGLAVCDVDAGRERVTVVCGAPNVRVGMKTALALAGARLPQGPVRSVDVRGVESGGMLLSAAELGLGADDGGILNLEGGGLFDRPPRSLTPGSDARAALYLDDVALDLALTPNRGDCLSVRGVARELGAINGVPIEAPPIAAAPVASAASLPARLADPGACPRYLGRVIEDVDVSKAAPLWLRERLRRCGLRSIDPVVDVTNYVLLELGQPLHAFDRDCLEGGIVVRAAAPTDELTLLNGQELRFDVVADDAVADDAVADKAPAPLLIADATAPLALAGVMGGARSAVSDATRNVFLECAYFAPVGVGAAARRFGLPTDAAHRYERGVDFALQRQALERATGLLLAIVGGRAGPITEALSETRLPRRQTVALRKARLDRLVGEAIDPQTVESALRRLEMSPKAAGEGAKKVWTVTAPSHRFDIEMEEDVVEEVLRLHGYNAVAGRSPAAALPLAALPSDTAPESRLADLLAHLGYVEAMTFSFVAPRLAELLAPGQRPLRVVNPVSSEHAVMRPNLLPGLVGALANNLTRQARRARLFEIGQCFTHDAATADGAPRSNPRQEMWCGGILYGPREAHSWAHDGAAVDFFDAKGDVERVLALRGETANFEPADDPVLHPGQSAVVGIGDERVGRVGRLHPRLEAELDLPPGVFVFELRVASVRKRRPRRHRAVSRQPLARRDLALVVRKETPAGRLREVVRSALGDRLVGFELFDLYVGEGVGEGEKSLGLSLTFQHPSRTLDAAEVDGCVQAALGVLGTQLGARLR